MRRDAVEVAAWAVMIAGACFMVPVLFLLVVLLVLIGAAVFALMELINMLAGDHEERS